MDMTTIDLNCDLGEGFGAWEMGNDAAMIELATSVNIACGFHAGDADIMRRTVELAKARGVSVGAHPGYRDLHGFGRRPIPGLKSSEIENLVAYQIGALQAIAARVVRMVQDGAVVSVSGKIIKMRTDTVCIHGDTPGAVEIGRGVRQALKDAGIAVAPFKTAN